MKSKIIFQFFLPLLLCLCNLQLVAQFSQQGPKLVGTGEEGESRQGAGVSLSADGNTAIVGGYNDNQGTGAVWIYTRSGGVWSQQGVKLVGTGVAGNIGSFQGLAVSLSADGNTAIVGGPFDNQGAGAVWIFTRSGGIWTQQGPKLVGSGGIGNSEQGCSVSLSADGNTAIVGGEFDNDQLGATWIFTRSGGIWTQQGSKLLVTGYVANPRQGSSVSLSADGNTALIGATYDDTTVGAAWIFTRSGATWTQQGTKLIGTGATGRAGQGSSVSLSADGNTAIVGGFRDSLEFGASWIFTRSGGIWTQQGPKLVGTGDVGPAPANQGLAVSISQDGNIAIVGGRFDNIQTGAAWIFIRSGGIWTQLGSKLIGTGAVDQQEQGAAVALSADGSTAIIGGPNDINFNGDGAAWIFINSSPPTITSVTPATACPGATITITGTNFTGATGVKFGGTAATSFTIVNATTIITAVLGTGSTGPVSVTTPYGSANSPDVLTVTNSPSAPGTISSTLLSGCPTRYRYSIASMPANATSVTWTVPAGGTINSGQGTTSITVTYNVLLLLGNVSATANNNCGSSSTTKLPILNISLCLGGKSVAANQVSKTETLKEVLPATLETTVMPNPTYTDLLLRVSAPGTEACTIRVLDIQGRFLEQLKLLPNETIRIGMELKPGIYLIEVRQNKALKTTKIIKY